MLKIAHKGQKITKTDLLMSIVFLVYIKPGFVEDIGWLDTAFNIGRFGLSIMFVILLILKRRTIKPILFPAAIFAVSLYSTYYHQGVYRQVFGHWIPLIGMLAWIESNRGKTEKLVERFFRLGELMILINVLTMILFPRGMWIRGYNTQVWFLGQKQDFVSCYLPTAFFAMLYFQKPNTRFGKFDLLVCILAAYSIIMTKPLSMLVCLGALIIVYYRDSTKPVSVKLLYYINIAAEAVAIGIAYFIAALPKLQTFLAALPSTGVDKLTNMNTRFNMWIFAANSLRSNLLLGRGQMLENEWYRISGLDYYHTIVHNLPLDIALVGGGIALSLFVIWNISAVHKLQRLSSYKKARIIGIAMFAFNILGITEYSYQPLVFSIFALANCGE